MPLVIENSLSASTNCEQKQLSDKGYHRNPCVGKLMLGGKEVGRTKWGGEEQSGDMGRDGAVLRAGRGGYQQKALHLYPVPFPGTRASLFGGNLHGCSPQDVAHTLVAQMHWGAGGLSIGLSCQECKIFSTKEPKVCKLRISQRGFFCIIIGQWY